jgi:DNA modification methylase
MNTRDWAIMQGDVLDMLRFLPDRLVQCVVTSPPYYGLRDYGVDGQLGLEKRPDCAGWATGVPCGECYVCRMTAVFREVKRVLRDDGVLWLNIGDTYSNAGKWGGSSGYNNKKSTNTGSIRRTSRTTKETGAKEKDLLMVPARLALSLQSDGWYLRSEVIWSKKAPMPESVQDRPTRSHETVWLLSKSARYYYDAEAVREKNSPTNTAGNRRAFRGGGTYTQNGAFNNSERKPNAVPGNSGWNGSRFDQGKTKEAREHLSPVGAGERNERPGRNLRDVWHLGPSPYPEAHFATFPPAIPERCIKAGSASGDLILDPFAGAGTTLLVANRLNRRAIGIELNPEYAQMAEQRIANDAPMFSTPEVAVDTPKQLELPAA